MTPLNVLRTIDHAVRAWVVTHRVHWLDGVMWMLSVVGRSGIVWLGIGAAIAWRRRAWNDFVTLLLALIVAWLSADYLLKPVIGRMRPFTVDHVVVIGGKPGDNSFPSGHAAASFAAARVLTTTAAGGWPVWWLLAFAIAYSRVYLGVHYPLDVLGGAAVGLLSATIILLRRRRVNRSAGRTYS